jgi:serine/threonine-protein kinase RsbW
VSGVVPETYLRLAMHLPRQAVSVRTARHSLDNALAGIGVDKQCRDDIALALTEACSNAVEHAQRGLEYDVIVTVGRTRCIVEVVDTGVGMDERRLDSPPVTANRGRGLVLIRAVTDGLEMRRLNPHGFAVCMVKKLTWGRTAASIWQGRGHDPWAVVPTPATLLAAEGF